jgi:hypothetical protein
VLDAVRLVRLYAAEGARPSLTVTVKRRSAR